MSFERLRKLARSGHTREIDKTKFKFSKFRYNRVRVRTEKGQKKKASLAHREAMGGQENIRTVHEPKPIQAADSP